MKFLGSTSGLSGIFGIFIALCSPLTSASEIFNLKDPINDDFSWGDVRYPTSMPVQPGELDLTSLRAEQTDEGVWFEAKLRYPIKSAKGISGELAGQSDYSKVVQFDFHAFNLELYIDKDAKKNSGTLSALPGRQVRFADDSGWEQVIFISSRPRLARLQMAGYLTELANEELNQQGQSLGNEAVLASAVNQQIAQQYYFPDKLKINYNNLRFFVPKAFLGDAWLPEWRLMLLVTAADPEPVQGFEFTNKQPLNLLLRPVKTGAGGFSFGGSFKATSATPQVIDMLLPSVTAQQRILSAFDARLNRLAVLPMLSPVNPDLADNFNAYSADEQSAKLKPIDKVELSLDSAEALKNKPLNTAIKPKLDMKLPSLGAALPEGSLTPAAPANSASMKGSALQRLRELKAMKAEGLINENEYQESRAQILKSL